VNSQPVWSPDGSTILWVSDRSGSHDLWLMNADGSNQRDLTNTPDVQAENPNWSPDGTRILFDSCPASSYPCPGGTVDYNVFVVNADGSGLRQLTTSPAIEANPAWSPDMRKIVYRSDASGNTEVWKMNADGSDKRKLTGGLQGGGDPDWQPLP
jgi:TolB protein